MTPVKLVHIVLGSLFTLAASAAVVTGLLAVAIKGPERTRRVAAARSWAVRAGALLLVYMLWIVVKRSI